ncbi:MAG: ATP-binding cassette domain-containing protein [Reyranella sp.]|uniref:ABC transporter ATP-binding protein n=1 Tax=Reyranella sp. TaxID=1929291 RepID=UPI000968FDC3|nr:oligopeptide/dipeptide ABC transporter ATP-binding protein [Reyranella sp.]MBN9536856.1 ATP-binding cassette domain-containing protein [Alphaproteobacteria bacterium]MBR2816068.1 ATP-binding cassette domain-containing protein [Reyranella sp.]OJU34690.1 MAG: peptide ABC transporter ATP-binding protein [Alphaproteobacteria bacterium 65-37]
MSPSTSPSGSSSASLLSLRDVHVRFNTAAGVVRAVSGVSLDLAVGETLGLVGESGCGKSTLGKAIMKLVPAAAGEIRVEGIDIAPLGRAELTDMRRKVQMIFQDPYGSLNPRSTVGRSVAQPMVLAGWKPDAIAARLETLLGWVGLPSEAKQRFPHEFSGGQRQRIGIARALALGPKLIICDEPVSALDVSVRAQVINLLEDLKTEFGVSYLFISHDLSVVEHIADRVAVMYLGTLVEVGGRDQIWRTPQHPYTKALLAAAPIANPKIARMRQRTVLQGELPSPLNPPAGCPFHSRCPIAQDRCRSERPELRPVSNGAQAACHFV